MTPATMERLFQFLKPYAPPFSLEKFVEFLPILGQGATVTVEVTLLSYALAVVVGLVVALGRMSPRVWLSAPFTAYLELVRNTPLLVQLYLAFWVLPSVGIKLPAFTTGVTVLGAHFGAYLAEVYRAGIESVPRGQFEAALALNMSKRLAMRRIILPQAIRTIIPAMGNYFVAMFKNSVLVSAIAIEELMFLTKYWASSSFRVFEIYTAAALFYFVISFPAARIVNALEGYLKRDLVGAQRAH